MIGDDTFYSKNNNAVKKYDVFEINYFDSSI